MFEFVLGLGIGWFIADTERVTRLKTFLTDIFKKKDKDEPTDN